MNESGSTVPDPSIGLMDSGVGGLSVMIELRLLLPSVDLVYFADSAHCPYGMKTTEEIRRRCLVAARALTDRGARVLVVACNTASAAALEWLRERIDVPVVGMEPAIKPAASATRNGRVGVLATGVTLEANRFARLLARFADGIHVVTQPALELVKLVERGKTRGPAVETAVEAKLKPLCARGIDTLVLGCTHYPFLKPVFRQFLNKDVTIIDTGPSVAAQAVRVFRRDGPSFPSPAGNGRNRFMTSGDPRQVFRVASLLVGEMKLELVQFS